MDTERLNLVKVPDYMDDPPSVLGLEVEELSLGGGVFFFFYIFLNMQFVGIGLGILGVFLMKKFKATKPRGFLLHASYHDLGVPLKGFPVSPKIARWWR